MTKAKKTRRYSTGPEYLAIYQRLMEVTEEPNDQGRRRYKHGWSDEAVAQSVHPELNIAHTMKVKRDFGIKTLVAIGHTRPARKKKNAAGSATSLLTRVEALEAKLTSLEQHFNSHCIRCGDTGGVTPHAPSNNSHAAKEGGEAHA